MGLFDLKADDWNIAAHVMLKKTPEGLSGVAFNAEIDMTGNPHQFVISGQWVIRKVLNYSKTWT